MKKQSVEEILAEYPKKIVDFFQEDTKLDGWSVTKKLGGYLPSPAQQFANKLIKKENEITYEVTFTFEKK